MNLVMLCTTTSAPCLAGVMMSGVKVLSTLRVRGEGARTAECRV